MQQISYSRKLLYTTRTIFLTLIFTVIFLGLFLAGSSFINVQKITIKGENTGKLRGLNMYYQKNLLFLRTENIEKSLLANNPELLSVSVEKVFPNSLIITVIFQPVQAMIEMSGGYAYLSEDGKIIRKSREKNDIFPLIYYYQKLNYSYVSAGDDLKYIDIISTLHFIKKNSELGLKTDSVDISGLDMLLFTIGDKKIFFTTEKEIKIQDYELEQIIKQFKIEGKEFKNLDLRFEKPIVTF